MITRTSISCTSAAFAELSADILRAGKALRFRASGASMQPLVRAGDVLLVRPLDPRAVRVGDVVLCSSEPGRIVVHRVLRRQAGPAGWRFTVQGDQVARPDGAIPEAQVYGWVATIERSGALFDMKRPLMRMLGGYAVLRSRWSIVRGRPFRLASRLVKRLPVLSRYLV